MFAWGIIVGLAASALLGALGKSFASWAKQHWFKQN